MRPGAHRHLYGDAACRAGRKPYELEIAIVDDLKPGDVAVFACGGSSRIAPWGSLLSTATRARGAAGCVTDGFVRDILEIRAHEAAGFRTAASRRSTARGAGQIQAIDVPVICGGVRVAPGDLVFGDADGVVVVPQAVEAEVLALAFDKINGEHHSMRELRAGAYLRDVYAKYGILSRWLRAPTATATSTSGTTSTFCRSTTSSGRVRKGEMAPKADADTLYREMADVEKAIVFALRYGDSIGIESNDETTAAAVEKYPDKFVGLRLLSIRGGRTAWSCCVHAIEDLGLKGAKFGPIYNGVALSDPRLAPVLRVSAEAQPAADHAHGDDLRAQCAGRAGAGDPCRAGGDEVPRSDHGPGPHGPPLVRGVRSSCRASSPTSTARSRRSSTGRGSTTTS